MDRQNIAAFIADRLDESITSLKEKWQGAGSIKYFVLDDLLPNSLAHKIYAAYPSSASMRTRRSLRELKHIASQMDQYDPILEETLFAFQDARVVDLIGQITKLQALQPDKLLYAGGISMMSKGHFLNPHVDNSHDKLREKYRVLNLLYYVSPHWQLAYGGNLELWPEGVSNAQTTVESRFNRLVVMVTNKASWHSVSPVLADSLRCCVSNYYFSEYPTELDDYFHVTSFRGRPGQPIRDLVLQADAVLRMGVRRLFPKGAIETKHFYNKSGSQEK